MGKSSQSKKPEPTRTPSLQEFQKAARSNVAERTPGDLSVAEVQRIRAYRAAGATCIAIAADMRIARRHVSAIVKFRVRADVPRPFETDAQRSDREAKHRDNEVTAKKRLEALSAKKERAAAKKASEKAEVSRD